MSVYLGSPCCGLLRVASLRMPPTRFSPRYASRLLSMGSLSGTNSFAVGKFQKEDSSRRLPAWPRLPPRDPPSARREPRRVETAVRFTAWGPWSAPAAPSARGVRDASARGVEASARGLERVGEAFTELKVLLGTLAAKCAGAGSGVSWGAEPVPGSGSGGVSMLGGACWGFVWGEESREAPDVARDIGLDGIAERREEFIEGPSSHKTTKKRLERVELLEMPAGGTCRSTPTFDRTRQCTNAWNAVREPGWTRA